MDRLLAMETFVRVVEAGTFTKAADLLDMPKPTVTRLIQTLETHLQTKLLNRTTRRVTVTIDGAAYYDRVVRLLGEVKEIESSLSRATTVPRGRLRIDVGAEVAHMLLIPALAEFHQRYPDIRIDLGISDRPVDLIGENVDCVVQGGEVADPSLVARRIGDFHLIVCASPGYLKRHGVPQHPLDIEGGHIVVNGFDHAAGKPQPFSFTKAGRRHEISGRRMLSVSDSNAALTAGLNGIGIIRMTTLMAQPHVESGRLQPLLLDWCTDSLPVHVMYLPNRHLSAKVRVFVDWVAALFARSDLMHRKCCARMAAESAYQPIPARPTQTRTAEAVVTA
ncbi:LysR family transcriptional regulator [Piscinibacter sp.]|uniref:LysR substrate-binding domain-containing protein n=1 Tax=Piscinibacter sp. TaxID=1903157 RepID=UPI002C25F133|nr:LysR family transcriptional regulator [Albitalea sp.]HUG25379.1 LysR family transcriptional regulator [Albitalea sp.]